MKGDIQWQCHGRWRIQWQRHGICSVQGGVLPSDAKHTLSILKNVQIWMLCQTCKHVGCALCSQSDSNDIPFTSLYLPAAKSSSISDGRDYGSIGHSRRKLHKRQQKCNLYSLKILKPTSATDKVLSATDQYSLRLGLEYCALKSSMRQKPFQVMWHPWS